MLRMPQIDERQLTSLYLRTHVFRYTTTMWDTIIRLTKSTHLNQLFVTKNSRWFQTSPIRQHFTLQKCIFTSNWVTKLPGGRGRRQLWWKLPLVVNSSGTWPMWIQKWDLNTNFSGKLFKECKNWRNFGSLVQEHEYAYVLTIFPAMTASRIFVIFRHQLVVGCWFPVSRLDALLTSPIHLWFSAKHRWNRTPISIKTNSFRISST